MPQTPKRKSLTALHHGCPSPKGVEASKIKQTSIIVLTLRLRNRWFGLEIYCKGFLNVQVGETGQFWYNLTTLTCCFLGACMYYVVLKFLATAEEHPLVLKRISRPLTFRAALLMNAADSRSKSQLSVFTARDPYYWIISNHSMIFETYRAGMNLVCLRQSRSWKPGTVSGKRLEKQHLSHRLALQ